MNNNRRKIIVVLVFVCIAVAIQQRWRLALLLDPIDTHQLSADQIVLYGTEWCGYCARARAFLDQAGVPYTDKDIERSPAAAREFEHLGGRGVPLIRVGAQRLHGYDPNALREALRQLADQGA